MRLNELISKALDGARLNAEEGCALYLEAPLGLLMEAAAELRNVYSAPGRVGWIIDRNVNITNICVSQCKFCNFCRSPLDDDAAVTTLEEYRKKIDELYALGGEQLLIQGGMHPGLGISFYSELFAALKSYKPGLKLHALGPPEIVYLSKKENISYTAVLEKLVASGLDSLPGAGAEILSDRVRHFLSPAKCTAREWLDVMRAAHAMNLVTSATMMFGHVETVQERMEHLVAIRNVHLERPHGTHGFKSFIPWPFQASGTFLEKKYGHRMRTGGLEYIRMIALSRLMLQGIQNVQASWLTVGVEVAQLCLHAGANDMGSIMIEENVVSQAGVSRRMSSNAIQKAIAAAGFTPVQRNQRFEYIDP